MAQEEVEDRKQAYRKRADNERRGILEGCKGMGRQEDERVFEGLKKLSGSSSEGLESVATGKGLAMTHDSELNKTF